MEFVKRTRVVQSQMTVNLTAPMPGDIKDWPANIQDAIYKAIHMKSLKDGLDWKIVHSRSGRDEGNGIPYCFVVIQAEKTVQ